MYAFPRVFVDLFDMQALNFGYSWSLKRISKLVMTNIHGYFIIQLFQLKDKKWNKCTTW